MGVYIKGMEMPPHCAACPIERLVDHGDEIVFYCLLNDGDTKQVRAKCRRPDCPLVPVPPHGDLIDRKTAYDSLLDGMVMTGYQSRALDCINDFYVPTIISAEEDE